MPQRSIRGKKSNVIIETTTRWWWRTTKDQIAWYVSGFSLYQRAWFLSRLLSTWHCHSQPLPPFQHDTVYRHQCEPSVTIQLRAMKNTNDYVLARHWTLLIYSNLFQEVFVSSCCVATSWRWYEQQTSYDHHLSMLPLVNNPSTKVKIIDSLLPWKWHLMWLQSSTRLESWLLPFGWSNVYLHVILNIKVTGG